MIKNIIFDFGNVIAAFDPDAIIRYYEEDSGDHDLLKECAFRYWSCLDSGMMDYEVYKEKTRSEADPSILPALERFFDSWYTRLPLLDGVAEWIRELKKQGFGLYILSNASVFFAEHSDYFGVNDVFDGIVFSGCIKMVKPDREIYEYLLHTYGLKPEECLFFDDMERNIEAAERIGIHGMVFAGDVEAAKTRLKEVNGR